AGVHPALAPHLGGGARPRRRQVAREDEGEGQGRRGRGLRGARPVRALTLVVAVLLLGGCAALDFVPGAGGTSTVVGESDDFIVVVATHDGETAEALARTHLRDPAKARMIEDFNGAREFKSGKRVVIPKRPWNLAGVDPTGYQLVPILVYHNLGAQSSGRLVLGVQAFAEQMNYLKREGYRVVSLAELAEPPRLFQRQLGQGVQFLAYPYGRVDDDLLIRVREQGYAAAFTVRRESNPSFARPLRISRSQIYSEMTLEQFARNLNLFHHENLR